jgi:uncharacterized protein involved in outer membrane biogenesis
MKLPGLGHRRSRLLALGVLLLPPLLWTLVLAAVPTDCARRTITARLSASSGRTVHIGGIRVGWLGAVSLTDLRIGAPDSGDDPWLRVRRASIDVSLRQLVLGCVEPAEIDVEGVALRVLRRADGSLELGDLVKKPAEPRMPGEEASERDVVVRVRDATVTLIDEPTQTRLQFVGVEGRATCTGRVARVPEMAGTFNGGMITLAAQLDRSGAAPRFEGQIKARDVDLDDGMKALGYLVPALAGTGPGVDGTLALDLYLEGQGNTPEELRKSLVGHSRVLLDPVVLDGSKLLDAVGRIVDLSREGRAGSVRSEMTIRNGRIATDDLTLDVARVPIVLSGWTDFDGRIDYRLRSDRLGERLPPRAREFLSELSIRVEEVADVRVNGTIDAQLVSLDGVALTPGAGESSPGDDRAKLRKVVRRFRDRMRR